jgi:recombination protein RecA
LEIDLEKKRKLEKTVNKLQDRWGKQAIHRLEEHRQNVTHLSTGFANLDNILGIGGLPSGRISELIGRPTSGVTTLALHVAANFQVVGGTVLFFDHSRTFDAEYAVNCGVELEQLVLIRPHDLQQAAEILLDLVIGGGKNLIVFETTLSELSQPHAIQRLSTTLDQLIAPLGQSGSTLIFLTSTSLLSSNRIASSISDEFPPIESDKAGDYFNSLRHYASVRLELQRSEWLYKGQEIKGYRSSVQVKKNKVAPADKVCTISIFIHQSELNGIDRL